MTEVRTVKATVRAVGDRYPRFKHTVFDYDGMPASTRVSERQYGYAICRRYRQDGETHVAAVRWSQSPKCKSDHFALPVEWVA